MDMLEPGDRGCPKIPRPSYPCRSWCPLLWRLQPFPWPWLLRWTCWFCDRGDHGRWCCHQKGGLSLPPVPFLGIEEWWWSLEKFHSDSLSTVLRYKRQVSSYSAYGDMESIKGSERRELWTGEVVSIPRAGRGGQILSIVVPCPAQCLHVGGKLWACAEQMREWCVQPAKPLSTPNMVTQGQDQGLWCCELVILLGTIFDYGRWVWIQLASERNPLSRALTSLSTEKSVLT